MSADHHAVRDDRGVAADDRGAGHEVAAPRAGRWPLGSIAVGAEEGPESRVGALLALFLTIAGVGPARVEATKAARTCTQSCTTALRECRAAAKALRAVVQGVCTAAPGDRRVCRRAAKRDARATAGACGTLRRHCTACCRAGGASCTEPEVALDEARTATALVPPAGGTVTATAADGTVFTLDIPAGALTAEETITLTPVTAFGPFALGGRIVAAVHAEPSGLVLATSATLTIALPQAASGRLTGLVYDGTGTDIRSTLALTDGPTTRLEVRHFSGFGAGTESSPELRAIKARSPSAASETFFNQFLLATGTIGGGTDPAAYVDILRRWYRDVIRPGLQGAVGSDPRLRQALRDYDQWLLVVQQGHVPAGLPASLSAALATEQAEALALIAAALRDAVARANARCLAQHSLAEAETALEWQVIAAAVDVDTAANALDLDTVLEGLCVEAVYDDVSYPANPPLGTPSELFLRVGLVFVDGVPATGDTMAVDIDPRGTVELFAGPFDTDPDGSFRIDFTPAGDRELRLDIHSCGHVPGRRRLNRVCQDAFVVRGLEVQPPEVTLAQGGTQQFQAMLFGQPTAAVTWSTTGGTVDANGLFTAATTAGTFEVRATSTVDGHSAAASVVVTPSEGLSGTVTQSGSEANSGKGGSYEKVWSFSTSVTLKLAGEEVDVDASTVTGTYSETETLSVPASPEGPLCTIQAQVTGTFAEVRRVRTGEMNLAGAGTRTVTGEVPFFDPIAGEAVCRDASRPTEPEEIDSDVGSTFGGTAGLLYTEVRAPDGTLLGLDFNRTQTIDNGPGGGTFTVTTGGTLE